MKIGVFIHVYYEDVLEKIMSHVRMIPEPIEVYISTTNDNNLDHVISIAPEAEVRVFPNRGRDVWPKVWGFADRYKDHEIILHLHTKKSLHSGGFKNWLDLILEAILSSERGIKEIVDTLRVKKAGMVCPPVHPKHIKSCRWRKNVAEASRLTDLMNIQLEFNQEPFNFPVGSMFWARAEVLQPLIDLQLPQTYFPDEQGQTDGTPAHAIERLFGILVGRSGLEITFVDPSEVVK